MIYLLPITLILIRPAVIKFLILKIFKITVLNQIFMDIIQAAYSFQGWLASFIVGSFYTILKRVVSGKYLKTQR